jgi:hypothetical protein
VNNGPKDNHHTFTLGCGHSSLQLELTCHNTGTGLGFTQCFSSSRKVCINKEGNKEAITKLIALSTVSQSEVDLAQLGRARRMLPSKNYSVADRVAATTKWLGGDGQS